MHFNWTAALPVQPEQQSDLLKRNSTVIKNMSLFFFSLNFKH